MKPVWNRMAGVWNRWNPLISNEKNDPPINFFENATVSSVSHTCCSVSCRFHTGVTGFTHLLFKPSASSRYTNYIHLLSFAAVVFWTRNCSVALLAHCAHQRRSDHKTRSKSGSGVCEIKYHPEIWTFARPPFTPKYQGRGWPERWKVPSMYVATGRDFIFQLWIRGNGGRRENWLLLDGILFRKNRTRKTGCEDNPE